MGEGKSVTNAFTEFIICVISMRDNPPSQVVVETIRGQDKDVVITQPPVIENVVHRERTIAGKKECVAAFRLAGVSFKQNCQKGVLVRYEDFRDKLDVEKQWTKADSTFKQAKRLPPYQLPVPGAAQSPSAAGSATAAAPNGASATTTTVAAADDSIGHATDGDVYHSAVKVCLTLDEVVRLRTATQPHLTRLPQVPPLLSSLPSRSTLLALTAGPVPSETELRASLAAAVAAGLVLSPARSAGAVTVAGATAAATENEVISAAPHGVWGPPPKRVRTNTVDDVDAAAVAASAAATAGSTIGSNDVTVLDGSAELAQAAQLPQLPQLQQVPQLQQLQELQHIPLQQLQLLQQLQQVQQPQQVLHLQQQLQQLQQLQQPLQPHQLQQLQQLQKFQQLQQLQQLQQMQQLQQLQQLQQRQQLQQEQQFMAQQQQPHQLLQLQQPVASSETVADLNSDIAGVTAADALAAGAAAVAVAPFALGPGPLDYPPPSPASRLGLPPAPPPQPPVPYDFPMEAADSLTI